MVAITVVGPVVSVNAFHEQASQEGFSFSCRPVGD